MNKIISLIILFLLLIPLLSYATPEYSSRSEQSCKTCHVESFGGKLTNTGLEYAASGYVWPPEGGYRVISPFKKSVRLFIGYLHILASFFWFGTILYVHLLLKPAYAEKGLPKGEVILGLVSMVTVGVTGTLLTISRVKSIGVLFNSPWGTVLCVKILIYLIMVSSALIIVLFVGRRLKEKVIVSKHPENGIFDPMTLAGFDGRDGRQALVAYDGNVYDVTELKRWKNGQHMKHAAGNDLTGFIAKAPHDDEKLDGLNIVGAFDSSLKPPKTIPQRIFYFVAYMNLVFVFAVILLISIWRWGI